MSKALYNVYRPITFEDVVGQDNVVSILRKSIEIDKIANGYLFIGNRGTGKTTLAKIFSKALNCERNGSTLWDQKEDQIPCNECDSCNAINEDKSMDVIELDAASNRGVDTIRDVVINKVGYKPRSKYKVYILDEVHMLTSEAWNAMLKTLEQPPSYCVFIFCTTNPEKIPKTIISRVQTFKLKDIENDDIVGRLKYICKAEKIKATDDALYTIARYAKGGMRDSISALDQLSSFGEKIDMDTVSSILGIVDDDVCCKLFQAICDNDYKTCTQKISDIVNDGMNIVDVFDMLCSYTRVYIKLINKCTIKNSDVSATATDIIKELTKENSLDYHAFIKLLVDGEKIIKYSNDKQLCLLGIISKYITSQTNQTKVVVAKETVTKEENVVVEEKEDNSAMNKIKKRFENEDSEDDDDVPVAVTDALKKWLKNGGKKK